MTSASGADARRAFSPASSSAASSAPPPSTRTAFPRRRLVNRHYAGLEPQPGRGQKRAPGLGPARQYQPWHLRLQHQPLALDVADAGPGGWRACHASISCSTVAAVSSIERRVTSITGQPRRAHSRRAHSSSAFTASSSTYSLVSWRSGAGLAVALRDQPQPVAPDLDQRRRLQRQPDHRAAGVLQSRRLRQARHQRHVGRLDAAIREIERGRRLGAARDADQQHVGLGDPGLRLPVIMGEHEMHCIDAPEIIGIQHILPSRPRLRLLADRLLQHREHRVEHIDHREAEPLAGALQVGPQRAVDHGREHRAGFRLDPLQHAMELKPGPDQAPAVIDDRDVLELGHGRAGDRVQRLAGRVGDQMQVDPVGAHGR